MLASSALLAAHAGGIGPGFLWVPFVLIPLFWLGVLALIFALVRRRWARRGPGFRPGFGYGPWAAGHGAWAHAGRSAESTLAQRFANGDVDEQEYRARLEVLRANSPLPPQG